MEFIYIIGLVLVISVFLFLFIKFSKKGVNNKKEVDLTINNTQQENKFTPLKEKDFIVIEEYQFTLEGTWDEAKKTSRNRQMLLMDMNSYSEVTLKMEKRGNCGSILVLNEEGYDVGNLKKEDQEKIINYIENLDYKLESGVEKFIRTAEGESLIIYVTVFEYK